MKEIIKKSIKKFKEAKIAIIGDVILDRYIYGTVNRISQEAPVPIVNYQYEKYFVGCAGNVAMNLASLSGQAYVCSIVGLDPYGLKIYNLLKKNNINIDSLYKLSDKTTILKTRIIGNEQQICRLDKEKIERLDNLAILYGIFNKVSLVILSDYNKGILSDIVLKSAISQANSRDMITILDPKIHKEAYTNAYLMTPNLKEAELLSDIKIESSEDCVNAGKRLIDKYNLKACLITRGKNGMSLIERNDEITHIPAETQEVFDVTGAGDTVVAVLALSLAVGLNLKESAKLANKAAGVVVKKRGTAPVEIDELF